MHYQLKALDILVETCNLCLEQGEGFKKNCGFCYNLLLTIHRRGNRAGKSILHSAEDTIVYDNVYDYKRKFTQDWPECHMSVNLKTGLYEKDLIYPVGGTDEFDPLLSTDQYWENPKRTRYVEHLLACALAEMAALKAAQ